MRYAPLAFGILLLIVTSSLLAFRQREVSDKKREIDHRVVKLLDWLNSELPPLPASNDPSSRSRDNVLTGWELQLDLEQASIFTLGA
ncbi:MAG: hypothetical protein V3W41_05645 [Planctomycetota bacterium]